MSTGNINLDIILHQVKIDAIAKTDAAVKSIMKRYPALSQEEALEIHKMIVAVSQEQHDQTELVVTAPPSFAIRNKVTKVVVDDMLNRAPERHRVVIDEHYWNNKTYEQIADMVHASKSYPAQLARDGVKRLRRSEHAPKLAEIYYGDRNLYRHTSRGFFKRTGCSVQEYELIRREVQKL